MARGSALWTAAASAVVMMMVTLGQIRSSSAFGIPEFVEFGECASTKPKENLSFDRYSGIWFAIETVPNEYTDISSCSMTNYTWMGDMMVVEERGLNDEDQKMKQNSLMHPTEGQPGVLTVDADGVPSAPYTVVATDYEQYSCVYSCMSFMGFRAAFSWVLSRRPTIDESLVILCRDLLAEQGVDPTSMMPVAQGKDCPYVSKLDSVLAYSQRVQAKAKAKEMTMKKTKTEPTGHPTIEEDLKAIQEELEEERQMTHELEETMDVNERELIHTMEVERMREEEEIQELREEVIHVRRTQRKEEQARADNSSSMQRQSAGVVAAALAAILFLGTSHH